MILAAWVHNDSKCQWELLYKGRDGKTYSAGFVVDELIAGTTLSWDQLQIYIEEQFGKPLPDAARGEVVDVRTDFKTIGGQDA